jgi:hypothetical protein
MPRTKMMAAAGPLGSSWSPSDILTDVEGRVDIPPISAQEAERIEEDKHARRREAKENGEEIGPEKAKAKAKPGRKPKAPSAGLVLGPLKREIKITPPKFKFADVGIVGTAPYVQHRFSAKSRNILIATQEAGSQSRKGRAREAKNFDEAYRNAMYVSEDGWFGIPASAFRNASISACRVVGFKMTLAKLSIFVEADGFDREDGTPLVRMAEGTPEPHFANARNSNGSTDVRCRPMWKAGWKAVVRMRWDDDQFSADDIANLMQRVGQQVGVGEGRPDSRMSSGLGWGLFSLQDGAGPEAQ